jgi:hypothetical protein
MAAFIVAALAWWASMGETRVSDPVGWTWNTAAEVVAATGSSEACGWSDVGSREFALSRECWDQFDNADRCAIVIHELGHAIGHEHSPDPTNVMAEYFPVPGYCLQFLAQPKADAGSPVAKKAKRRPCHQKTAKARKRCRRAA